MSIRLSTRLAAAGVGAALVVAPAAAVAQEADALLTIVHAFPEAENIDVYLAGYYDDPLLAAFEPGEMLEQPVGSATYDFEVYVTGDDPAVFPPIITEDIVVGPGQAVSAVANIGSEDNPPDPEEAGVLETFIDDRTLTACGEGRLTVRHVASTSATELRIDGDVVETALINGTQSVHDLPTGEVVVELVEVATGEALIEPVTLEVQEGHATTAYLVNPGVIDTLAAGVNAAQDTTGLLVDTVDVGAQECDDNGDPDPTDPEDPDPTDPQDPGPTDPEPTGPEDPTDPATGPSAPATPRAPGDIPVPTRVDSGSGGLGGGVPASVAIAMAAGAGLLALGMTVGRGRNRRHTSR